MVDTAAMLADGWQQPDELPSRVRQWGEILAMIKASRSFAARYAVLAPPLSEPPAVMEPIPVAGLPVNLITHSLHMGGAERHTVELAAALARLGCCCTVASALDLSEAHRPLVDRLEAAGVPLVEGLDFLPDARATIWWGSTMRDRHPPGSIYVVHSASKLVELSIAESAADIDHLVGVAGPATRMANRALDLPSTTIWNGAEPAGSDPSAPRRRGYTVGYFGRYDVEKAVPLAIAALAHTPEDVRLRCYGRGPHKGALADAADHFGVGDRVDICGTAPDLRSVINSIDALVVPDLVQGLPMTLPEALLAGLPVVATRLSDMRLLLADGRGVAVEPTPRAIADGIATVREGHNSDTAWARRHLSAEAMAAAYSHVIRKVVQ